MVCRAFVIKRYFNVQTFLDLLKYECGVVLSCSKAHVFSLIAVNTSSDSRLTIPVGMGTPFRTYSIARSISSSSDKSLYIYLYGKIIYKVLFYYYIIYLYTIFLPFHKGGPEARGPVSRRRRATAARQVGSESRARAVWAALSRPALRVRRGTSQEHCARVGPQTAHE